MYTNGQHNETTCFRVRPWDRAGNFGEWTADAQACTTVNLERSITVQVGALFGDTDSDDTWDAGEITLTNVSLRFVDVVFADVVTPAVGSSWALTTPVMAGNYTLIATPDGWGTPPPGWLPRWLYITVLPGETTWAVSHPELGLKPHLVSYVFPLVMRSD